MEFKMPSPFKRESVTDRIIDPIINTLIFLILAVSPIFFTGLVAQDFGFDKIMLFYCLTLIAAALWITKAIINNELRLIKTPLDKFVAGSLAIFVLATALSDNQTLSLMGSYNSSSKSLIMALMVAIFYYLLVNNSIDGKIKKYVLAFAGGGVLASIITVLQLSKVYIIPFSFAKSQSFNMIGSSSALTAFLTIILPLLIIITSQTEQFLPKNLHKNIFISIKSFFGIGLVASLICLTILGNFTYWPAVLLGSIVITFILITRIIKINGQNFIIPLATFFILIVLFSIGKFNFTKINLPAEVSLSHGISWDIAKNSLKKDPIFGSGLSTYDYNFGKYKDKDFSETSPLWNVRFNSANGGFFELMSTAGIAGAVAITLLILLTLSISFFAFAESQETDRQILNLGLFSSFLVSMLLFATSTQSDASILIASLISALTAACATAFSNERTDSIMITTSTISKKHSLVFGFGMVVSGACLILLFSFGTKLYIADVYAKKSISSDTDTKIELLNQAIALAPEQDNYQMSLAQAYMQKVNNEASGAQNTEVIKKNLDGAITAGKKAADEINPKSAANNEAMAIIYENASLFVNGALEMAIKYHSKNLELEPSSPFPNFRIALVKMAMAKQTDDATKKEVLTQEALKDYEEAIKKKSNFSQAYYGEAVAYQLLGKNQEAAKFADIAAQYAPDDTEYRFELGRLYFNLGVSDEGMSGTTDSNGINVEGDKNKILTKNENLQKAEQIFISILKNNPNHANSLYSLVFLNQRVGDKESAKNILPALLNLLPEGEQKESVKKQFADLQ